MIVDAALRNELRALLDQTAAQQGDPWTADELLATAAEAGSFHALAQSFPQARRDLLALAFMIVRADDRQVQNALRFTSHVAPLYGETAVRNLIGALERSRPEPGPGEVYRDLNGNPVIFVVSYPRSGNTRFLNLMQGAYPRSRHAAYLGDGAYFSPYGRAIARPGPVFVKDHLLREAYRDNPVIYLARDGRDAYLSLNDYLYRSRRARGDEPPPSAFDSLRHLLEDELGGQHYGRWEEHVSRALAWRDDGRTIHILTYDAITGDDAQAAIADVLGRLGLGYTDAQHAAGLETAAAQEAQVRARRPEWSREPLYPEGTMMARWLAGKGTSRWRELLDADDRRMLHEAGLTAPLLQAGFETDPDWWRKD